MELFVNSIAKSYGDVEALKNTIFKVQANQIVGLVGPNGAGKTTLLSIIANFIRSDAGKVLYDGRPIPPGLVAYTPEFPELFPVLTVWEHFKFTATAFGITGWESAASEFLDKFNMQEKKNVFAGELSKGMKQKLMVGISLLRKPKILLLDEPFSGLDPVSVNELRLQIKQGKSPARIILISSHNLDSIQHLCDRVLVMHRGELVRDQNIDDILKEIQDKGYRSLEELFLEVTGHEAD